MRTPRPILLASAAAAVLMAAACSGDAGQPAGPTIARSPSHTAGLFTFSATPDTMSTDSVVAGYGNEACGGLEYQSFEYDAATQTEYVVCADTTVEPMDTTWIPYIRPTPPPPTTSPAPAPAPAPAPIAPEDSVIGGYGSGSTGGIEYDRFEYDPEARTEPMITSDPDGPA